MQHAWEKGDMYTGFILWKNQKESDHYKNPGECGWIIIKWIFEK
jgi:hypothetical protein